MAYGHGLPTRSVSIEGSSLDLIKRHDEETTSLFHALHRKSGAAFEKSKKTTSRQVLADAGQDFSFEESCNACHMNYKGSPWKGAKEPYTPFTPEVDKKYTFDFDKYVKDTKAMHEHFKLDGVFTGDPKFKYHDEFQASAKVGEKGSDD